MSKPSSPMLKDKLQVEVRRGSTEEPTMVIVSIDRSTMEPLPYRGGFKDIRTGRYLIRKCLFCTIVNYFELPVIVGDRITADRFLGHSLKLGTQFYKFYS